MKGHNTIKQRATDWKKIATIYVSDKGLVFRMYKEHLYLNNKKSDPIEE